MLRQLNEVYAEGMAEPVETPSDEGNQGQGPQRNQGALVSRDSTGASRTGLDFGLKRPVRLRGPASRVVVQNDIFNRSAIATSVVCLITSNL